MRHWRCRGLHGRIGRHRRARGCCGGSRRRRLWPRFLYGRSDHGRPDLGSPGIRSSGHVAGGCQLARLEFSDAGLERLDLLSHACKIARHRLQLRRVLGGCGAFRRLRPGGRRRGVPIRGGWDGWRVGLDGGRRLLGRRRRGEGERRRPTRDGLRRSVAVVPPRGGSDGAAQRKRKHPGRAFRPIAERQGRVLRVVYTLDNNEIRVVTAFFDRARR